MKASRFFLIFVLVLTLIFAGWYLYRQNDNGKIKNVIDLVRTKNVTVNFKTGTANKTLEEMIMFYNPTKKELTIGGLAGMSSPKLEWSVNKITDTLYKVRVKNTDNNCNYNFLVLPATGEVRADDQVSQTLLNPNGF